MKHWDEINSVSIIKAKDIESSWPLFENVTFRLRIGECKATHSSLPIDALLVPGKPDSKRLIVTFHGAIDRSKIKIPRFEWRGQLANRDEHKLFIADTTLELSSRLNLAWYIGTPEFDLTGQIQKFIRYVKDLNDISEIILMGSSGGGFAALSVGCDFENCCSLAYSPQTNIWDFTDAHSDAFIKATFSGKDEVETKDIISNRTDLLSKYKEGRHLNNFVYYQNLGDIDHLNKHWKRFANAQGVQLKNGRSFNQQGLFVSDFDGEGHVRPPILKTDEHIDLAFRLAEGSQINLIEDLPLDGNVEDFDFVSADWLLESVPMEWLLYVSKTKFIEPSVNEMLSYNNKGVPLRVISGEEYDHPVLQAQTGLELLNNFFVDGCDSFSVGVVESIINHLVDYSLVKNGALFFPFGFAWHQEALQPPWYSAMAQGQVLQLVCRFIELTGKDEYLPVANAVFKSLTSLSKKGGELSVVHIDTEGYLWFEEYPYPEYNKFVLNGHIFSSLGVYEYWKLTGTVLAKNLFLGACSTVRRYLSEFRNPSWSSSYDLRNRLLIRNYHQTHIMQLEILYRIIGDDFFSRAADTLDEDFPNYQKNTSVYFAKGTHLGFKADNSRVPTKILESKEFTISDAVSALSVVRTKIESEDGVWLYFEDDSIFSGYWFEEIPKKVFPRLCVDRRDYPRPRKLIVNSASLRVNGFNKWASPIHIEEIKVAKGEVILVLAKAMWNGEIYLLLETTKLSSQSWYLYSSNNGVLI